MNRRNILKAILAAAVSGAVLSGSSSAAAQALGLNKYATLIDLQQDVLTIQAQNKDAGIPDRERVDFAVDKVLGFAMANFDGDASSTEAFEATSKIFNCKEYCDTLNEAQLRSILEVVVPIAVMRNLLSRHRIHFDPRVTTNWDAFANKYQELILAA
jgi:hypothetical protein